MRGIFLLADDDSDDRELMHQMLCHRYPKHDIRAVADGEKALALIGDGIACVISDVDMPRLDGYRVCWAIRNSPLYRPWRSTPVVLVSGLADEPGERAKAWTAGTSIYLHKPFSPEQLEKAVQRACGAGAFPCVL